MGPFQPFNWFRSRQAQARCRTALSSQTSLDAAVQEVSAVLGKGSADLALARQVRTKREKGEDHHHQADGLGDRIAAAAATSSHRVYTCRVRCGSVLHPSTSE